MKFGILTYCQPTANEQARFNIGDYIQSLAALQFVKDQGYLFLNREALNEYKGETLKMILNGWFMHHPGNWPPSEDIDPLFVSFHLNNSVREQMATPENLRYFKAHAPIGCRDTSTRQFFQSHRIEAYYSGCLTLTLGRTYKSQERSDTIYIVDPIVENYSTERPTMKEVLSYFFTFVFHFFTLKKIGKIYIEWNAGNGFINKENLKYWIRLLRFYRTFKNVISKEVMLKATYITHFHEVGKYPDDSKRFALADDLLRKYASARYVITSRIHCALPCLGLGTPVIYINNTDENSISQCRFGGLGELFQLASVSINKCKIFSFPYPGILKWNSVLKNSEKYQVLEKKLWETCSAFVHE